MTRLLSRTCLCLCPLPTTTRGRRAKPKATASFRGGPLWLASVAFVAACDLTPPTACSLVGCNSVLTVEAPALDDAAFSVTVESDTWSGTISCAPADAAGERGPPVETTGDIAREEADAVSAIATCDRRGVTLRPLLREAADELPTSAIVTITSGADTFVADDDDIAYAVSQPNGPDCEPTCSTATLVAG
jgi:hypothetical protein